MNNNTLYIMCGLPGSGKSYQAKKLAEKTGAVIVSSDALREELFNDVNNQDNSEIVFRELHKRVKANLLVGKSVIYDACNVSDKRRRNLINEFKRYAKKIKCVLVLRLIEDCIKAQDTRDRKVPQYAIERMYKKFKVPNYSEGYSNINIIYTDNNERVLGNPENILESFMDFNQHNSHHSFTLGAHSKRVLDICLDRFPHNKILEVAAMMHDMGKPYAQTNKNMKGEEDSELHYYGHAEAGSYLSLFLDLSSFDIPQNKKLDIAFLIGHHMDPYYWENTDKTNTGTYQKIYQKYEKLWGSAQLNMVMALHNADERSHVVDIPLDFTSKLGAEEKGITENELIELKNIIACLSNEDIKHFLEAADINCSDVKYITTSPIIKDYYIDLAIYKLSPGKREEMYKEYCNKDSFDKLLKDIDEERE